MKSRKYFMRLACLVAAELISTRFSTPAAPPPPDQRVRRVDAFFQSYGCPVPNHAADYVRAADEYGIDYRILPVISLLETTCGFYQRANNHWGWNSGNTGFGSVPQGIDFITRQLAEGEPYRKRDLDRKLFAYNPFSAYVSAAKRLMREIDDY